MYVCVNCLKVYLSVRGENPTEHAVRQELVTIDYDDMWLLAVAAVSMTDISVQLSTGRIRLS